MRQGTRCVAVWTCRQTTLRPCKKQDLTPSSFFLEERWATLGRTENGKLLVVIHTFEETGATSATVRIISAREATRRERENYEEAPR